MSPDIALETILNRLEQKVDKLGSDVSEHKGEMREALAILRTEIEHLVNERDREIEGVTKRLDDHEGRLRTVEAATATSKGATRFKEWAWPLVLTVVLTVIGWVVLYFATIHSHT